MTKSSSDAKRSNQAGNRKTTEKRSSQQQGASRKRKVEPDRLYDDFFDEQAAIARNHASKLKSEKGEGKAAVQSKSGKSSGSVASNNAAKGNKVASSNKSGNSKPAKKKPRKSKRKRGPLARIMQWFIAAACLVLCWCLFAYYMIVFNEQQPLMKADAGIILGAALWNDQPSPALKERLNYAIKLYEENYVDYLILSGGKPENRRGLTEAEGMKAYLLEAGVPEDRLLLESHSRDTYENLLYSKRVADKYGIHSVMIITHHYHTKRAEDIARYVDFKYVQTAGFDTEVLNESYHYTREMLAYTKWQLNKLFIPLGMMI